ncbi:MAG TPA: phosphoribosyltransferase family protein [Acidimicrobiia bacterium]|nr:phosphoribosyltransferase family protein [Acidimicrobiia bacterium]
MAGYRHRREAGLVLAGLLEHLVGRDPLVLGIPRGGVVVAAEIATAIGGDLGVLTAVKVRAPQNPELAVGAVTPDGIPLLDAGLIERLQIDDATRERIVAAAVAEVRRRQEVFGPVTPVDGRTVVVTDDGVATGATLRAALAHVARGGPSHLVCALPVGPPETIAALTVGVDEMVCPLQPRWFGAVGEFYGDFDQVSDAEVLDLLR